MFTLCQRLTPRLRMWGTLHKPTVVLVSLLEYVNQQVKGLLLGARGLGQGRALASLISFVGAGTPHQHLHSSQSGQTLLLVWTHKGFFFKNSPAIHSTASESTRKARGYGLCFTVELAWKPLERERLDSEVRVTLKWPFQQRPGSWQLGNPRPSCLPSGVRNAGQTTAPQTPELQRNFSNSA